MVQQILDEMRTYLEAKTSPTEQEQTLLRRLNEDFFPITSVSRDDLQACGFDTRSITDGQMHNLAKKMANDYCDQLFWSSMEIIAKILEFPQYPKCPVCDCRHVRFNERAETLCCERCGQEWHENLYVLVGAPEDASYFEKKYIGYPSFESRNGAMYVPEYDYVARFKEQPEPNRCFMPLRWPESQPYLSPNEPDDALDSLNEPIKDDYGIEDFGENAVWVQLCNLKH